MALRIDRVLVTSAGFVTGAALEVDGGYVHAR